MDLVETISSININNETPLNIENFAANNITYIITQFEKIGNLYSVEAEQVQNGIVDDDPVYNLNTLLGGDNIEIEAGIRYIAGQLDVKKPLLFSLTLKNYKIGHLKHIVKALKNFKSA